MTERDDDLYDELTDMQLEILDQLRILIECDWDSNTVKGKLTVKLGEWERLMMEVQSK